MLANVSNVYFALGQFEKGIDYLEKDLKTSIEFHDWEGEAMAYTSLSAACHILYQNEKAIEYCGKGLKIFRGKGIRQGEGRSCLNLLSYYLHLGDYATTLKYSEEALKAIRSNQKKEISVLSQAKICKIGLIIKTAMADQQGKYQCYLAFGKTYNSLGQYIKAIHSANSLKMGEELEIGDGSPLSIMGSALYYRGPFEESIEYFTKDLPICKAPRDHCGEGDYCGLTHFGKIRIIYYKRVFKVYLTLLI